MAHISYASGSTRSDPEGKGRFDLLPYYALERYAQHMERGCEGHGARNWEKGQPSSRSVSSAIRHLTKYAAGLTDEDHLAAAFWNVGCTLELEGRIAAGDLPEELHDLKEGWESRGHAFPPDPRVDQDRVDRVVARLKDVFGPDRVREILRDGALEEINAKADAGIILSDEELDLRTASYTVDHQNLQSPLTHGD